MEDLQSRQHIARGDDIDPYVSMSPLDCQARSQMPDSSFRGIVRGLGLRNIDNGTRHGSNHHHTAFDLPLHKVFCALNRPIVSAIDVNTPELVDSIWWVSNGIEILSEASRGNQMINFAVVLNDLSQRAFD